MKVIVVSNYYIFHQSALWDNLIAHKDIDLVFLATANDLDDERKKMKYENESSDYVKYSHLLSEEELKEIYKDVDFVIYGLCLDDRVAKLSSDVPHLLVLSEHLSKRKSFVLNELANFKWFVLDKHYRNTGDRYLLAMSSYAYHDYKLYGFKNKAYRFGYFPHLEIVSKEREPFSIVWFGRVLSWKRVDLALYALKYFLEFDKRYHLDIIGEGDNLKKIKSLTKELGLEESVRFLGFMSHDDIMNVLPTYSIHMFTSHNGEGWGVALNEGLASGCLCIANEKAGSSKFLIDDNSGFLFKNKGDLKKIVSKIASMNNEEKDECRKNAQKRISELWNVKEASNRLYELLLSVYNHIEFDKYQSGPISKIK